MRPLLRSIVPASLAVLLAVAPATAQGPAKAAAFDSSKAYEHVRQLVSIGPRPAGSAGNQKARDYLLATLKGYGITAAAQPFEVDTPVGRVKMANVVATLPGRRAERIVLASHFDSKLYREFRFVGANDSGSSTGALLELGRVLKDRPRDYTIELLFLDGEEAFRPDWGGTDHTYGSRMYVELARKANTLGALKALVLLDMVGDRDLAFRKEANSTPWLTDLVWNAAASLGHQRVFLPEATPIEDDHVEFLKAGVPATDIIDLEYPAWHTANDTLDQVSARSLQITGDVVLAALPAIEKRLASTR
jgi:glutaminyl-peptide cyclotransferase